MAEPLIRCPHYSWEPAAEDRWECTRTACGTSWNTFWTRGVCPGCAYQWRNTQCFACAEFSPHEAWYQTPDGEAQTRESEQRLEQEA